MFKKLLKVFCLDIVLFLPAWSPIVIPGSGGFADNHPDIFFPIFSSYLFFAFYMFYYIPEKVVVFPAKTKNINDREKLVEKIKEYYTGKKVGTGNIFDIQEENGILLITWSGELAYNQLINVGKKYQKTVFTFRFDEKINKVFLLMIQKQADWKASIKGLHLNYYIWGGISSEYDIEYKPSLKLTNNIPHVELKKFVYNSDEIINPAIEIINNSGWDLGFTLTLSKYIKPLFISLSILSLVIGLVWQLKVIIQL